MKRFSYILHILAATATLAAASLFGGCSADTAADTDADKPTASVKIDVKFSLRTQESEPRPLISPENIAGVSDMRLYLFRSDTYGGTYTYVPIPIPEALGGAQPWIRVDDFTHADAMTHNEEHTYDAIDWKLDMWRYYKILAVGRDDLQVTGSDTDATSGGKMEIPHFTATTTLDDALLLTNTANASACELFTGFSRPIYIDAAHPHFEESIELTRAVAGVVLRLGSIPTTVKQIELLPDVRYTYDAATETYTAGTETFFTNSVLLYRQQVPDGATNVYDSAVDCTLCSYTFSGSEDTLDGYYVNLAPGDEVNPNVKIIGSFVTPQPEGFSLMVRITYTNDATAVKHVYLSQGAERLPCYPLLANHYYEITGDVQAPDLTARVVASGNWQEAVDIEL